MLVDEDFDDQRNKYSDIVAVFDAEALSSLSSRADNDAKVADLMLMSLHLVEDLLTQLQSQRRRMTIINLSSALSIVSLWLDDLLGRKNILKRGITAWQREAPLAYFDDTAAPE